MNKIKDFPVYSSNPVKMEGVKRINFLTKVEETLVVNPTTDEVMKISNLPKEKYFLKDSLKYIKIFKDSIKQIINLSSGGLKLWGYIIYNLDTQTDTITIYPEHCVEFCGYKSSKNIYPAIIELLREEFIFRKEGSNIEYFINVNVIYNGRRKI